jgi:hypothetical protein
MIPDPPDPPRPAIPVRPCRCPECTRGRWRVLDGGAEPAGTLPLRPMLRVLDGGTADNDRMTTQGATT